MMKKHLLIVGLLCGLAGLPASAQVAQSPNNQQPGTPTPGTPPTFPTDRQETNKDRQNRTDTDAETPQTDKDKGPAQQQDPNSNRDDNNQQQTKDRSDYPSQLQNALQQQPNLSGVQVNYTDSAVELTGSVPTGKDKHEARMMAQDYANGRKVVDHITVSGRGN